MAKKILIVAIVLFTAYSLFVGLVASAWWSASQHQWQANIIKAQRYMYSKADTFDNVVVGSSLADRLVIGNVPKTYNLSFAGQSIYDGLSIIAHRSKLPKNVFIEMNVVLRKERVDFTTGLNMPVLYYLKKDLLSMQEDRQPLAVLGGFANLKITSRVFRAFRALLNLKPGTGPATQKGNTVFAAMLQLQKLDYSKKPDPVLLKESFNALWAYAAQLKAKGVRLIFFEMPVNYQLSQTPKAKAIRQAFYNKFPPGSNFYIPLQDSVKYSTTDGSHLGAKEALKYTAYFKSKMEPYLKNR